MYIIWAVALALLLAAGLFSWLVVVPVWQVHKGLEGVGWTVSGPTDRIPGGQELIDSLGGPSAAVSKLGLYLRMPRVVAGNKLTAIAVLEEIGPQAIPVLEGLLDKEQDVDIRQDAAGALKRIRADQKPGSQRPPGP
jgi:hypothetical protein